MENQKQNRDLVTRLKQGAVVAGSVAMTGVANAAVDTADITAELTAAATAGAAVAAVAILIPLGIKVFKYIRSAF